MFYGHNVCYKDMTCAALIKCAAKQRIVESAMKYTPSAKNQDTLLMLITSQNINRFSQFFHS